MLAHSRCVSPVALVLAMAGMQLLFGLAWLQAMIRSKRALPFWLGLLAGTGLLYAVFCFALDWSHLDPE